MLSSLKFILSAESSLARGSGMGRRCGMRTISLTQESCNKALCETVAMGLKSRPSTGLAKQGSK